MSAITLATLRRMKHEREPIAMLTAYDASFATLLAEAGVEIILVGDSLGMVVQGQETTLPVSMDEIIYHSRCVARGNRGALIMTDMPFMADASLEQAVSNAGRLMKEGGAQIVKLEGGAAQRATVAALSAHQIPVCAHLGLQPQAVHKLGGYRVQGREASQAEQILSEASALVEAGADMLLLECVPAALARQVTEAVPVPVIGIGAGADTDGQVLVLYDLLGITPGKRPKFSHDFLADGGSIAAAVAAYVQAVKTRRFPAAEHCFD